jgi:hypothetical protein
VATRQLLDRHRRDLAELVRIAQGDIALLFRRFNTIEAAREALMDVGPQLIEIYGSAAVVLGADWYDEVREVSAARGAFRAIPAEVHDAGSAYSLAGWAASEARDVTSMQSLVVGGLQKRIADMDRRSITRSSVADPASAGWRRIGAGACEFCRMLIERDQTYTDETADFASHTSCRCQAYPLIKGAEPIDVKDYLQSARNSQNPGESDAAYEQRRQTDRDRVKKWLADNPSA